MKLIDLSPLEVGPGRKEVDWQTRLRVILKYGWKWYQRQQAEAQIIPHLQGVLDNRFALIRGFALPQQETPLPPILVGPVGVMLLYVWPKGGFFRIREGQWEVMLGSNRRYRPGKPNMVEAVKDLARSLSAFLEKETGRPVEVAPLMVFTNPAADVDAVRPEVTPVLLSGLKRYAFKLTKASSRLSPTETLAITEAFRPKPPEPSSPKPRPQRPRKAAASPRVVKRAARYFDFTPAQWAILGALALAALLTFMFAIIYVLATAT